jgi:Tfp pilus assembly protein FimV
VVAVAARSWRPYAAPAAFLAAVTLAVIGVRALWPHHAAKVEHASRQHANAARPTGPGFYRVRAGDTLATIATKTHIPIARLRRLNPAVQPTALFIGQRLRLR